MPVSVRECSSCGYLKPKTIEFFSPEKRGEFKAKCRECRSRESAIYYLFHRANCLSRQREHYENGGGKKQKAAWRAANPRKVLHGKLRSTYGISVEEYEGLAQRQGFCCAICRKKKKLFVDHCHKTSLVRGLLCSQCNTAIGMFYEDIQVLEQAQAYLRSAGILTPQDSKAFSVSTA